MDELAQHVLGDLDLRSRRILDAATGAGKALAWWAEAVAALGGTSRIISIDNDLSEEWTGRVLDRLGAHRDLVELRNADIFEMTDIEDSSIDIVNCHDTLVFLAMEPLRVLRALAEFRRVLAPGGLLVITSEHPSPVAVEGEGEGQWRRWALAKAIRELKGETWSAEIAPSELENALRTSGFEVLGTKEFPPKTTTSMTAILEWRNLLEKEVANLPWSEDLRKSLERTVRDVAEKILSEGKMQVPGQFVTKARKQEPTHPSRKA